MIKNSEKELCTPSDFEKTIIDSLFLMQDIKYRDFHSRLIPEIEKSRIIGVRTPMLRKFAKELFKDGRGERFLSLPLPHYYYEENNLRAFLIEQLNDFDEVIRLTEVFLPYVDNWATCDMFSPKIYRKNRERLLEYIKIWLNSEHTYMVRYAIVMLMDHFLDEDFDPEYLNLVCSVDSEEYYINMAAAWYFSIALVKQYDSTVEMIKQRKLKPFVHNKAIQKACESRRISSQTKEYLRSLKIKQ